MQGLMDKVIKDKLELQISGDALKVLLYYYELFIQEAYERAKKQSAGNAVEVKDLSNILCQLLHDFS